MKHPYILSLLIFSYSVNGFSQAELPIVNTDSLKIDSTSFPKLNAYQKAVDTSSSDNVYICNSTGSTKYHYNKNCRGIDACKAEVLQVSKSEAINRGKKTLCGFE
ncbi:MAG: hypothetical protein ACLGGV_08055 [Bacteroidia bacterium]